MQADIPKSQNSTFELTVMGLGDMRCCPLSFPQTVRFPPTPFICKDTLFHEFLTTLDRVSPSPRLPVSHEHVTHVQPAPSRIEVTEIVGTSTHTPAISKRSRFKRHVAARRWDVTAMREPPFPREIRGRVDPSGLGWGGSSDRWLGRACRRYRAWCA